MGSPVRVLAVLLLAAALVPAAATADTRYITDVLLVNLRDRPDPAGNTLRLVRSGEALEVVEVQPGFLRVRTEQGEEGWVAEQYATEELPKALVATKLQGDVGNLRARIRDLEGARDQVAADLESARKTHSSSSTELQAELSAARGEAERAARELKDVSQKYQSLSEASKHIAEVTAERDRLRAENETLGGTLARLEAESGAAARGWAIRWFLAGAGVLLVGWVLGAITRKKKARFSVG